MNTLKAEKRSREIKAKKLRREGYVTGNIFGRDMKESVMVKMEKSEVERVLKTSGKGSRITLDVEGQPYSVLIKDIDYNSLKRQINEIDFQALVSDEKIQSVATVVPVHHEMVAEGVFQLLLEEIAYRAFPDDLVEKVEFDAGQMKVGDSVKVGDLDIARNKDIDLVTDPETVVAVVSEVKNRAAETEEEDQTEAEA